MLLLVAAAATRLIFAVHFSLACPQLRRPRTVAVSPAVLLSHWLCSQPCLQPSHPCSTLLAQSLPCPLTRPLAHAALSPPSHIPPTLSPTL
jgi:hypothetical protein